MAAERRRNVTAFPRVLHVRPAATAATATAATAAALEGTELSLSLSHAHIVPVPPKMTTNLGPFRTVQFRVVALVQQNYTYSTPILASKSQSKTAISRLRRRARLTIVDISKSI